MEVMKIMVTSLKMSHSHTATLSAYDPEAGHHRPMPPVEILDIHAHVWVSFLCVSLLFSPGSWCAQVCCCAFQEPISTVLCEFCWFYDGVNGNLLQEGLCHTQSSCSRLLLSCTSTGGTQTQFWLSLCVLGMCLRPSHV